MATDSFEGDNNGFLGRFARVGIGVGVAGYAGQRLWTDLSSNRPIRTVREAQAAVSRSGSQLGSTLRETGAAVRRARDRSLRADDALNQEFIRTITATDYVSKMSQTAEETRALLDAVLGAIDDPTTGLDQVLNPSIRDNISNLMSKIANESDVELFRDQLEESVGSFVKALSGGPSKNRDIWQRHLNESRGLMMSLSSPVRVGPTIDAQEGHKGLTSIEDLYHSGGVTASGQTKKQVRNALQMLESRIGSKVDSFSLVDGNVYADITRKRGKTKQFVAHYPLGRVSGDNNVLQVDTPDTVLRRMRSKNPVSVNYHVGSDFSAVWRLQTGYMDEELATVRSRAGVPVHTIPFDLDKGERSFIASLRGKNLEEAKALFPSASERLRQFGPDRLLSYVQSTSTLPLDHLPVLKQALVSPHASIRRKILSAIDEAGSLEKLDIGYLREILQAQGHTRGRFGMMRNDVFDASFRKHQSISEGFTSNALRLDLGSKIDKETMSLVTEFASHPETITSVSSQRLLRTIRSPGRADRVVADVGVFQGSIFDEMDLVTKRLYEENGLRMDYDSPAGLYVPATSRPGQVAGRSNSMFVGNSVPLSSELFLGPGSSQFASSKLTGTRTQAYLLVADPRGKAVDPAFMDAVRDYYMQEEPSGQFTTTGYGRVREGYTKTIVAPEDNDRAVGKALKAIREHGQLTYRSGSWYAGEERVGTFLGRDLRGQAVHLPSIADMKEGTFGIAEEVKETQSGKLKTLRVLGLIDRDVEGYKGFSFAAKGLHERTSETTFRKTVERLGGRELLGGLVSRGGEAALEYTALGAASTITKSTGYWEQQLMGAHRYYGGKSRDLVKRAQQLALEVPKGLSPGERLRLLGQAYLLENQAGVMNGNMDARDLGRSLAGMASHSLKSKGRTPWLQEVFELEDISSLKESTNLSDAIESSLRNRKGIFASLSPEFIEANAEAIMEGINSPMFLAFADVAKGEGPGDWKGARASMDPRQASILAANLRGTGMASEEVSQIMGNLFNRMEFSQEAIESASGLMSMARQVSGLGGMADVLEDSTKIGFSDLFEMKGDESIGDFLRRQGTPLQLDWGRDLATRGSVADTRVAAIAQSVFGKEGLTLANGRLLEALEGANIQEIGADGEGKVRRRVSGKYEKLLTEFFSNMEQYVSNPDINISDAEANFLRDSMTSFKARLIDLAAQTQVSSMSGKLSGSFMAPLTNYKTTGGFAITTAQQEYISHTTKLAKGRAMYADDNAILNILRNYDGKDLAKRAERIFMSAYEQEGRKHESLTAFAVRQPTLGFGHVAPVEVFRAMGADGFSDQALRNFQEATGRWGDLKSFADLKGIQKTGVRYDQFWDEFASHLKSFAGEGGGKFYAPTDYQRVAGIKNPVDMGFMMGSYADNDGDHVAVVLADSKSSKTIYSAMKDGPLSQTMDYYKHSLAGYGEVISESISAMGKNPMYQTDTYWDDLTQEVLKESGVKLSTGPVDIQLNKLRMAAFDIAMADPGSEASRNATRIGALFASMQEKGIIKSKHLDTFLPMGRYIASGIHEAMKEGGSTQFLRDTLSKTILSTYEGTMTAGSVSSTLSADMKVLDQVVAHAKRGDWGLDVSAGALSARLRGSSKMAEETFNAIRSGGGVTGSYTAGYLGHSAASVAAEAQDLVSRVGRSVGRMDLGVGTYAGLAMMGGALAASALAPSYSSEPLTSKYDRPSAAVRDSIAGGTALTPQPSSQSVSPPGNAYAMMGHRFDEKATYTPRQNAFQVRGQVASPAHLDTAVSVLKMNQGGPGHITVGWNDDRRPITPNYVDRLMGHY